MIFFVEEKVSGEFSVGFSLDNSFLGRQEQEGLLQYAAGS